MIGHIQGIVLFSDGQETVIQTASGVGYQVYYNKVLAEGGQAALYISHIVKETGEDLYGFANLRTKKLFEMLLTVSGVGPKSAYSLQGAIGSNQLIDGITLDNKKLLTSAPGIGPKGAAQIILDLSTKIHKIKMYSETACRIKVAAGLSVATEIEQDSVSTEETVGGGLSEHSLMNDALMACKELGFKEEKIIPLVQKVLAQNKITRAEQLVHLVLREI